MKSYRLNRARCVVAVFTTLASVFIAGAFARANEAVASPVRRFHVALVKAEPGFNDTVSASPAAIKLWFSEPVQAAVTGARVVGPDNRKVSLGAMHIEPGPKSPVVAPLLDKLESGKYTVAWKTMADDGHPASGTFTFVVRLAGKKS